MDFKLKQLYTKDIKFDYFFELKNFNCDEILDLYHLFRRTNYEIALTIALENDPIDEKTKVEFLVMYTNFLFIFFRYLKCIDLCNCALFRDSKNPTINFFKSSLVDLCHIVKHDIKYEMAIEIYRRKMLRYVNATNVSFDREIVNNILKNKSNLFIDKTQEKLIGLLELPDEFAETELGKNYWSKEKDYYLKKTLFLNPLNNFGRFAQCSLEKLLPLEISKENQELFNSIVEDYKHCRKKLYEFVVLNNLSLRDMCTTYSFAYSIYDKIAFLFKNVYDIDIQDYTTYFDENLFNKKFKKSKYKFSEIKNPAIIPIYYHMKEYRSKNKVKGVNVGTCELNEYRNIIEHRSTSLISENELKSKSEVLIRDLRDLIIESYLLLMSAESNMTSDDMIVAGTSYAKAIYACNELSKQ